MQSDTADQGRVPAPAIRKSSLGPTTADKGPVWSRIALSHAKPATTERPGSMLGCFPIQQRRRCHCYPYLSPRRYLCLHLRHRSVLSPRTRAQPSSEVVVQSTSHWFFPPFRAFHCAASSPAALPPNFPNSHAASHQVLPNFDNLRRDLLFICRKPCSKHADLAPIDPATVPQKQLAFVTQTM